MTLDQSLLQRGEIDAETASASKDRTLPRAALSTAGTFHSFDMARQLEKAGMLAGIHTGYPRFKLRDTGIPSKKIHTFPWLKGPYMAGWVPLPLRREWEYWDRVSFDNYVSATLPECDIFCGLSGSALKTAKTAKSRGAQYVCDRGSSHIRYQDRILRQEYERWAIPFAGIDPRTIAQEEAEYDLADMIMVPSQFAFRSFVEMNVPREKLRLVPYGVDLVRFNRCATPTEGTFNVIFVGALSVRKGARYLMAAYEKLIHPKKTLTFAGVVAEEIKRDLAVFQNSNTGVYVIGHVPQTKLKQLMSQSHVLVLPSIEEGFGLVQAQAMACGCPVIASNNTGAADLFSHGVEGLIVKAGDVDALTGAMQNLADNADTQRKMSGAAMQRVTRLGGWNQYGATVRGSFKRLVNHKHFPAESEQCN